MTPAALAAIGSSWLIGILGVAAAWPRRWSVVRDLLLILSLGYGVGIAVTSATFFFATVLAANPLHASLALDVLVAAVLASCLGLRLRRRHAAIDPPPGRAPLLGPIFAAMAVQAAVASALVCSRAYAAEPYGRWDGWAIWNMHARFLYFGGDAFRRMLQSPQIAWSHLDYPLLVPAAIARAWAYSGSDAPAVSALISILFGAATVGLLVGAVSRLRSPMLGCLAGLVALGTPFFVNFSASQYADVPLGFFVLAAAAAVALCGKGAGTRTLYFLAGAAAGMAAWTKNEGLLLASIVFAGGCALGVARDMRRRAGALLTGLLVALVPVLYFKFQLSPPNDIVTGSLMGRLGQITDGARHRLILSAARRDFALFGEWSVLPFLAMALPILASGRPRLSRHEWAAGALAALILAGYYCVYLLTPWDLQWHLDSSLVRLLLQVWPTLIFLWCLCINPGAPGAPPATPLSAAWRRGAAALFIAANVGASSWIIWAFSSQTGPNEVARGRVQGAAEYAIIGDGWFGRERAGRDTWAWSRGNSALWIQVEGPGPVTLALDFKVRGLGSQVVTATIGGRTVWRQSIGKGLVSAEIGNLMLRPGMNMIVFSTDSPGIAESPNADARALTFALYNIGLR
jgi:hypothetical protein